MGHVNTKSELFACLEALAEYFNRMLFDGSLPTPLICVRPGIRAPAWLSTDRWRDNEGTSVFELAINADLLAQASWLALMQTLVFQQCRLWQVIHGDPSRPGYYNSEWANKMEEIGLMPSSTGRPGGKRVGQGMSCYVMSDGQFLAACAHLATAPLELPLSQRWSSMLTEEIKPWPAGDLSQTILTHLMSPVNAPSDVDEKRQSDCLREVKRKVKYACRKCGVFAWGRPNLHLVCQTCQLPLKASDSKSGPRLRLVTVVA